MAKSPNRTRRPDPRRSVAVLQTATSTNLEQRCIDRRIERLGDCTRDLLATTEELTKRLEPVMLSLEPADTSDDGPKPIMTDLGAAIDRQADYVLSAVRQLQSILQRLGL